MRRGNYFLVKHGRWFNLGRDKDQAVSKVVTFNIPQTVGQAQILKYAYRALARARANCKGRRKLAFDLTQADVLAMLEASGWRCAVTGTGFSMQTVGPFKSRPYAPSIDRVDNSCGYSRSNCRVVCVAANFAMNRWDEDVLWVLARNMRKSKTNSQGNSQALQAIEK